MRQRVITGIIFTIVIVSIVLPMYYLPIISMLFAAIVGVVSIVEMIKALKAGQMKPATSMMAFGMVLTFACALVGYFTKNALLTITIYSLVMMMLSFAIGITPQIFSTEKDLITSGVASASAMLYVTFPLICLMVTSMCFENGWYYVVMALFAPWISDTFAYFTGVTMGKHKIVPHISPKKTWEGCIGGAIGCAVVVMLYIGLLVYDIEGINTSRTIMMVIAFVFGLFISVFSQIGDWLASSIKRFVGIKDFGSFMPGHGGMLDRFDSVFFTLPIGLGLALISSVL